MRDNTRDMLIALITCMQRLLIILLIAIVFSFIHKYACAGGFMVYDSQGESLYVLEDRSGGGYNILSPQGDHLGTIETDSRGNYYLWGKDGKYRGSVEKPLSTREKESN